MNGKRPVRSTRRIIAAAVAVVFALTGVALAIAPLGLQNPSFENDLDGWTARTSVYSPLSATSPIGCAAVWQICVVNGADTFQASDGTGVRTVTVAPNDGGKMVRLGGPYHNSGERQQQGYRYYLEQTFRVDPANPLLRLNYNLFTFDYTGFDELKLRVTITDQDGATILERIQGAFSSGTNLKTTGWRSFGADLSGYENQQVFLRVELAGTLDNLFGTWGYIDAGTAPVPPPPPVVEPVELPGGGTLSVNVQTDPSSNTAYIVIPKGQAMLFPNGCVPLTLDIPIPAGSATLSNVVMYVGGQPYPMTQKPGSTLWSLSIPCVSHNVSLTLAYNATEDGQSQSFSVPYGGIYLIDPQGVIYDKVKYDAKIAEGSTPEAARTAAAIKGATVRLQREVDGAFVNVLSADPGIKPNVNPEITPQSGVFQWDVSSGTYRVKVTAPGYDDAVSAAVVVPPPALDVHVGLVPTPTPAPPSNPENPGTTPTTGGAPAAGVASNAQAGTTPTAAVKGCAALKGTAQKRCRAKQALDAKVAKTCGKLKGAKRSACARRVRALDKCRSLKAAKRKACVRKARKLGRK